jgi:hypothetical protein
MIKPLLAAAFLLASTPMLQAQPTDDSSVLTATVRYVQNAIRSGERVLPGGIAIEPRKLVSAPIVNSNSGPCAMSYGFGERRPEEALRTLTRDAGTTLADFDRSVVCASESPRSCRLEGVSILLALGDPEMINDSTAQVVVAARWRSDLAKMPVGFARHVVTVTRMAGTWSVTDMRTIFIS